jgi:dihydroflavonol-4-reductase
MNLVTGGAGFLGSHLVDRLLADGEPVRVLERPGARVDHLPLGRIELVRADIRDAAAVRAATRGSRRVYHLAADPNLWRRSTAEFDAVNHRGALNVIESALDQGAERILHTSTESILTSRHHDGGAVEDMVIKEADMLGPYCLSKYRAEVAAMRLANAGAPVIIASPTLPVGPGDRQRTPPTRMSLAFCRGKLPAYMDARVNLVDARDVAEGMVLAMRHGRPGVRYLLGGHNRPLGAWLALLGTEIGRKAPRFTVPYPVALGAAWASERWADYVTHRVPNATVTGVRLTRRSMFFDASRTVEELGFRPRPLEESAHDAVAWYRSEGLLHG